MDEKPEHYQEPPREDSPIQQDHKKLKTIQRACNDNDLESVIHLATTEDGLVSDDLRQRAWPILLGSSSPDTNAEKETPWKDLPAHRDEDQVQLDVDRSFCFYPEHDSDKQLDIRKKQLSNIIVEVLRRHPYLSYFQGFHDIVQVFLLVLGPELSVPAVRRLTILRIRDFMLPKITGSISQLNLIPSIIHAADPALYKHLPEHTYFAISAIITLYAHDIQKYSDIARLYDFLLAREAVTSLYLFAAIVLSRKDELLELDPEEEKDMIHYTLSKLPVKLDLEPLIASALKLFEAHPPEKLPKMAWSYISKNSVLKTTRDSEALARQTFEDGKIWFDAHAEQIRKQQARDELLNSIQKGVNKHKRPAAVLGVTVAVGVLAWWLAKRR
ncbi:putative tbc domain protein [Venturia nashicola]|nr:putative tbc domain protein [Venturia nashicola]